MRLIGIGLVAGEQDGLALGFGLVGAAVWQETGLAPGPQTLVERSQTVPIIRTHQGPPALGQRLFEQFRQNLFRPGTLEMIKPDISRHT